MARKPRARSTREILNAVPTVAPDVSEECHFYRCPSCDQQVDARRLGDVLHHEEPGHEPLIAVGMPAALRFIEPMLPTLADMPPGGDDWTHEIKYDGYRTQLQIRDGEVRAFTRNGHDWSDRYRPITVSARRLPCETAVIDGEVIIQDEAGRSDFHGLRSAITNEPHRLIMMCFDLLELDGQNLRKKPIERRRELLAKLIGPNEVTNPIQFSADIPGDGAALFQLVDDMGMEGIVSKKLGTRYVSGRSLNWLKVKCYADVELVVVGTEKGEGAPVALLAREEKDGSLHYMGGAMVTLRNKDRDRFWQAIEALAVSAPPIRLDRRKGARWVRPEIRVLVRTLRGEEKLRHATVQRLAHIPEGLR